MKLSDVALLVHGTSDVRNRTHPVFVRKWFVSPGNGSCMSVRAGGLNTETIKSPVNAPIKTHKTDSILLLYYYGIKSKNTYGDLIV